MQRLLGFSGLILGAVAYHGITLGEVEVECDQGAVLHAQGPQSRTINLKTNACKKINLFVNYVSHLFPSFNNHGNIFP